MKKVLLTLAGVALLAVVFSSCKKDHDCTCTATGGGMSTSATTTIKDTKSKAKDACEAGNSTQTVGGTTFTTKCELD